MNGLNLETWLAARGTQDWTVSTHANEAIQMHRTLPGYEPTPLVEVPEIAAELCIGRFFVKDESKRFDLGAFKFLGASWAVGRALKQSPGTMTLTTATDGNHGRAIARMAKTLGLRAVIFTPNTLPQKAIDNIEAEGAEVNVLQDDYNAAIIASRKFAEENENTLIVQDTSWEGYEDVPAWIVEGYSTLFVEADEQLAELGIDNPDLVSIPVGVGSLAQAAIAHYRDSQRQIHPRLLSVEPTKAASILASLHQGSPQSIATEETLMNGLNCGTPSAIAWPYLKDGLDAAVAVADEAAQSTIDLLAGFGLESGPSGAASVAGIFELLTGTDSVSNREKLGINENSVILAISTEGAIK
ncbi:MAG: pyridoxal-phosphate dependent enzyme [Microbacteriaceae bacterium]|nr:pyridoxal-phosphate dependent enzyme [Microbacteriaceae bacterium]